MTNRTSLHARMMAEDDALQSLLDETMTDIQQKIADYLKHPGSGEPFTLRCFVGMIETGEATPADFEAVGGIELRKQVEANL
jgi:hypothetical protein